MGGKEVFIKSVLQAFPLFVMSYFLLPKTLYNKFESIMARFWWSHNNTKREVHWCTWSSLSALKDEGRIDLVSIWNNYWLPGNEKMKIYTEAVEGLNVVADLINQSERSWNLSFLESNFSREEVDRIKIICIPYSIIRDSQSRSGERTGLYTVRSEHKMLSDGHLVDSNVKATLNKLWKIEYPYMGFHRLVVEGDVRTIVERCRSAEMDLSKIRSYIKDIKEKIAQISECHFRFTLRFANKLAHALASEGLKKMTDLFFVEDAPHSVLALIEADRRHLDPP
ncbi:hypothetical protein F3Y22_tig00110729pilonHSYRG00128 [Hibiscus syriacus]|uniref:RNase H type-1 domain-containing protein n=1 Tax=Hibiscus syriacus TaxID=106335 RepID=A0A6A2ZT60_HIBSY|nr:hypothetical protein F3Y22_tig00110729pilonHSYRG00128 [Hibiscus syriacus]